MRIAVYCSSRENIPQSYRNDAAIIGNYIGSHRHTLIYGGIGSGLMETVSVAAHATGARVVGIVPVTKKHLCHGVNDENILACDLSDRKAKMIQLGELFIVLPGGYGTLDEMVSTFSSLTFTGDEEKRIIMLDKDGLFEPILSQLQLMIGKGLMSGDSLSRIMVADSAHECCKMIGDICRLQNDKNPSL